MTWGMIVLAAALCCGLACGQTLEELQQLQELFEQAVAAGTTPKPGTGPGSGGQVPGSGGQVPGSGGQVPGSGGQVPVRPNRPNRPNRPDRPNRPSRPVTPSRPPTPPVTSRPPPPVGGGGGQGSSSGSQGCRYFCRDRYGRYVPCC